MKRAQWIGSVLAIAMVAASLHAAHGQVSPGDREKLVEYLSSTRDQVLAEGAGLTDAQWTFKAGPDRWSVGEVVEHLALAESFLFEFHEKTIAAPAADAERRAATRDKDALILKAIPDRSKRFTAPEPLQPGESLGSRAAVLAAFKERRARTIDHAGGASADWRAHVSDSPLGPIDGYQWLLFMGAHTERHLAQLREVKAHPDFPKASTQ